MRCKIKWTTVTIIESLKVSTIKNKSTHLHFQKCVDLF